MRIFLGDRFAVVFALLFPLVFTFGFSLAFSAPVEDEGAPLLITVATRETADERLSAAIIEALSGSEDVVVRRMNYEDARLDVEAERLGAFVAFPTGFTASLMGGAAGGDALVVEVISHAKFPEDAAAHRGFAQQVAARAANVRSIALAISAYGMETGAGVGEASPALPQGWEMQFQEGELVFVEERVGEARRTRSSDFTLPGYLTMFIFFAAAISAESIARERRNQTLERLIANGVRRQSIIFGKFLASVYTGAIQVVALWGVGILVFRVELGASPFAIILVSFAMVFASSAFGVMLGGIARSVSGATSAAVLASIALAPLGGSWWPLFITPTWMQNLSKITPHGWANEAFNNLMLFGARPEDVVVHILALAAFGAVFLTVAFSRFRAT